jgi:hypothetical protein
VDLNIESSNWIGVVENSITDPLKNGGCRVRIIGTHPFDTSRVPTMNLPVAQLLVSPNSGSNFSTPKPGDWVTGYYLDGQNKQWPVITGILRGLINNTLYVKMTGAEKRAYDSYISTLPVPIHEPTIKTLDLTAETPAIAQGEVANTSLDYTNSMIKHACDITLFVNQAVSAAKVFVGQIITIIRKGINAILNALDISPGNSAIMSFLKDLKEKLKAINKFLNDVILEIANLAKAIAEIKAVIEYILSLPARFLAMFKDCLNRLYAQLAAGVFQIASDAQAELGIGGDDTSVLDEFRSVVTETQKVTQAAITIASAPAAIIDSLYKPSGMTPAEQEDLTSKVFEGYNPFKRDNFQGA